MRTLPDDSAVAAAATLTIVILALCVILFMYVCTEKVKSFRHTLCVILFVYLCIETEVRSFRNTLCVNLFMYLWIKKVRSFRHALCVNLFMYLCIEKVRSFRRTLHILLAHFVAADTEFLGSYSVRSYWCGRNTRSLGREMWMLLTSLYSCLSTGDVIHRHFSWLYVSLRTEEIKHTAYKMQLLLNE